MRLRDRAALVLFVCAGVFFAVKQSVETHTGRAVFFRNTIPFVNQANVAFVGVASHILIGNSHVSSYQSRSNISYGCGGADAIRRNCNGIRFFRGHDGNSTLPRRRMYQPHRVWTNFHITRNRINDGWRSSIVFEPKGDIEGSESISMPNFNVPSVFSLPHPDVRSLIFGELSFGLFNRPVFSIHALLRTKSQPKCKTSVYGQNHEGRYFEPPYLSLAGLFLFISSIASLCLAWTRLNDDFATNMHIPRDTTLFIFSVLLMWSGMLLVAAGFGVFTHV